VRVAACSVRPSQTARACVGVGGGGMRGEMPGANKAVAANARVPKEYARYACPSFCVTYREACKVAVARRVALSARRTGEACSARPVGQARKPFEREVFASVLFSRWSRTPD